LVGVDGSNYQRPKEQCRSNAGPIPGGKYVLYLRVDKRKFARVENASICKLTPANLTMDIQRIPAPDIRVGTGDCLPYWQNWGSQRIRIEAFDDKAKNACQKMGGCSGFYIHDSHKGFTHGCIEVLNTFSLN